MSRQRLRIFVSSPGDVTAAREVAAQIIEKLAQEYARFFSIEPYLWEFEPMIAAGHFQDSIEPPSRFDAVILILESRLGTLLPERTTVREYRGIDGRTPLTGTEWEFEDALAVARATGVPDLLVYRSRRKAQIDTWDAQSRQAVLAQIEALDAFWSRHFGDGTQFLGGYAEFKDLQQFAKRLENDLCRCIDRRIATLAPEARTAAAPLWPKPPFRGLESYQFEHAPIFFGREGAIGAALLRLLKNTQEQKPFLLVLGASGSGKSSLVRAGLLPRLLVPKRVTGSAFLRRSIFRVSEKRPDEDLFTALARRLTIATEAGIGLPELLGSGTPLQALASHLRETPTHPELPFVMVLEQLAAAARQTGQMLEYEQAKFILFIDQLEELFTVEHLQAAERARFMQLLAGLVRSNRVWVIATMRADFWHRAGELPELLQLADVEGRLDLAAPSPAELSQMIRGPAERALIHFETHPATGIPLNDQIAEAAASEPGALPLMSYLLDQLYQRDVQQTGGSTLTYASYEALGGLKGAIATRADAIVAAQAPEVQRTLRHVLFALVQLSASADRGERAVARRAPLTDFPQGTPHRRLIEALLDPSARLLVADFSTAGTPTVALAHEALISEWRTAREYVEQNAGALKIRRTLEERFRRWSALASPPPAPGAGEPSDRRGAGLLRRLLGTEPGLLSDLDLNDAMWLLREYREELDPALGSYIEQSVRAARRRHTATLRAVSAVAVVLAVLTAGAVYEARRATEQRTVATRTEDFLVSVFKNADPVENQGNSITARALLDRAARQIGSDLNAGVQADLLTVMGESYSGLALYPEAEGLLSRAMALQRAGLGSAEERVQTLNAYGQTLYLAADYDQALKVLTGSVRLARARLTPSSTARSEALTSLADVQVQLGDYSAAERLCIEALAADRKRGADGATVLASTLSSLGMAYYYADQLTAAEASFREALAVLTHAVGERDARTGQAITDLGAVLYQAGRFAQAAALYQQALPIYREVYGEEHTETATLLNNIARSALMAGQIDQAEAPFRRALAIDEKLEGPTHDDLVSTLNSLGMIDAYRGNTAAARAEFTRADAIARLPDHGELLDQVVLNEADLALRTGDRARAVAWLAESRRLLEQAHPDDRSNAWRYAVWSSVDAQLTAVEGRPQAAMAELQGAEIIIRQRYGSAGFYTLLAERHATFIGAAAAAAR